MHNARYLSQRKKNILILKNLYIIFILFIFNLNSLSCHPVSPDFPDDKGSTKGNAEFCLMKSENGKCENSDNVKGIHIDTIIHLNIGTTNNINIKINENTVAKKENVVNDDENKSEGNNENESKTEYQDKNISSEKEYKTETIIKNMMTEYIVKTYNDKVETEYKNIPTEHESKTENYYIHEESYNNSEYLYNNIKNDLIQNFNKSKNNYIKIATNNNYSFQITTVNNQMDSLLKNIKSEFSVIDLKECTKKLNKEIGRDEDADLIILKYENENQANVNQKSIQYEIYNPETNNKLDSSVCSNITIDIYIPVKLNEETQQLYEELKNQGYNLFNKNDKFYTDICTPYKSKDGTDILLSDRLNEFFAKNELSCQANCEYSDFLPGSEYLKCECKVVNEEKIETKEPEKITAKSTLKSFNNILKYSNYKVLKYYKLVFGKISLFRNKGSTLTIIYFLGFFFGLIIFCFRKFIYINEEVNKLFIKGKNEKDEEKFEKNIIKKNPIIFNKRALNKKSTKKILVSKEVYDKKNVNKNSMKRKNDIKSKSNNIKFEANKGKKINKSINIFFINKKGKRNKKFKESKDKLFIESNKIKINKKFGQKSNHLELNKKIYSKVNKNKALTDYELNDLEYGSAIKLDNRNFFNIYFYFLKREHIIFFTFFYWNDFNIFSIKLSKFFLAICTDMAFNVFFFSDESMHNVYLHGDKHDFISQLAQTIYSTIASQILQVFINYLTMTDITYYKIKELVNERHMNRNIIKSIMECLRFKIIIFFSFSFFLFLFYWYLISAFCSVYENTQRIFITDSISSFILGLLYPFVLYLFPALLRILSLKVKKVKFLYLLSDKIPFF